MQAQEAAWQPGLLEQAARAPCSGPWCRHPASIPAHCVSRGPLPAVSHPYGWNMLKVVGTLTVALGLLPASIRALMARPCLMDTPTVGT